ncbi:transcriptional regulator [Dulcicalothrix desertica PCC 7102]|uniref:Transcriptional regulator n=1 Tax=Dulcicalothrix desertica PCC 7102 TaxID=232991 RepID=A0A433V396_9CYAN|nr:LysR family transcriptional regulator [Dulcicalothrix desertica]RUT00548.1 transcriptional regulator [Dulcicalothrix desertica PCC 7102]TWH53308.1 LysR family transcriptional regulator for bpeEF and oprC [Dulcicalothrix desertica PCC 7102]
MDKLNSLVIFVRAAQYLSFSEAARQLGTSPSTVSKAVLRLEEDMGIRLMNRTTRSITLTADGEAFYNRCRQILAELEEAELEVKRSLTTPTGTLRIDLSSELARLHIIPALPRFLAQYPDLKVDVSLTNRMVDLIEESIDAVVRIGIGKDNRLIMQRLATAKFIVCAAPNYLQKYGTPTTIADLHNHNCINFISAWTGKSYDWRLQQDGEEISLAVEGNIRLDNGEAILATAIAGVGIAQLYNYVAAGTIAEGKLKPILQHYALPGSPISIVYPQRRHLSAKVHAFVEFMQELMNALKRTGVVD